MFSSQMKQGLARTVLDSQLSPQPVNFRLSITQLNQNRIDLRTQRGNRIKPRLDTAWHPGGQQGVNRPNGGINRTPALPESELRMVPNIFEIIHLRVGDPAGIE